MRDESQKTAACIHLLRDEVARKIAAGEVIDRPQSVVRELLDNALDAGARNIQVRLSRGGTEKIRVVDDGDGMVREDLDLCWLAHATSKIESEDDLLNARSLGFRGEALASIATVSRLEIVSNPGEAREEQAGRLLVHGGRKIALEPWRGPKGTSVEVAELFYSLPARKKFLKSAGAETSMCRLVVLDRALAFPEVAFRYFTDENLKAFYPAAADQRERILQIYPEVVHADFLKSISGSGQGFSFEIVLETPDVFRTDRKHIQTFVNRRRIWDFAFVQALEYAYSGYLPGGRFPVAYLFLEVDPQLVDFNIHPAKREARFRNMPDMHHRIVEVTASFLAAHARRSASHGGTGAQNVAERAGSGAAQEAPAPSGRTLFEGYREPASGARGRSDQPAFDLSRRFRPDPDSNSGIRYMGQIMGLFLVAEMGDRLLLVDQHAAHERLLYDRFMSGGTVQPLLVPLEVELEPEQSRIVADHREELLLQGIDIEPVDGDGDGSRWRITSVPAPLSGALRTLVEGFQGLQAGGEGIVNQVYATMACRSAVMDGDAVDAVTAMTLIENSLRLENPRCPHGRPIWHELSRERLFQLVGRIP